MAQIGLPYRIMYLSKNRSGLTDVIAYVFKPDQTIAGYFPMEECPAPFQGCYFYDYISSITDVEGDYFSKVISPTERNADIVRFELFKPDNGQAQTAQRQPTNIFGFVNNNTLEGLMDPRHDTFALLERENLKGDVQTSIDVFAVTGEDEVKGSTTGQTLKINLELE